MPQVVEAERDGWPEEYTGEGSGGDEEVLQLTSLLEVFANQPPACGRRVGGNWALPDDGSPPSAKEESWV